VRYAAALIALSWAGAAAAQTAPAFEAASIKANHSGAPQMMFQTPPSGVISAVNVNVQFLIRFAFDLIDNRIVNVPRWAQTEHVDIIARAPSGSSMNDVRLMFRTLLAERFALRTHTESREMPVDVLTRESDGKLGPALTIARERCPLPNPACGVHTTFGHVETTDGTMADLAAALAVLTRRVVVDRTGLTDRYALTLTYTPDDIALQPSLRTQFPTIDADGPSLATALREQLGLRMQSTREPVDVLVVDAVDHPPVD
jgi:uncharacterized protein (TIGR03435 family)